MARATRLVIWRHGQTDWNAENRFQGHADIPLNGIGERQAFEAARLLAALAPERVVSSDLQRARQTASALVGFLGSEVRLDPRLRETDVGAWSGRTIDEVRRDDADAYDAWVQGLDVRAGGAENRSDVSKRMVAAITDFMSGISPGGLAVVVTHGGAARAAIGALLGLEVAQWPIIGGLANCSWSLLEQVGAGAKWRLAEHNAGSLPIPVMSDDPGPSTAW